MSLKYYYIDNISKQQCGPFTSQELLSKNIQPETMVWRSGMPDWMQAGKVQDLSFLFHDTITAPQAAPEKGRIDLTKNATIREKTSHSGYNNPSVSNTSNNIGSSFDDIIPLPKNWLIEAIILSVICCSPVSVVGIYYASQVESRYAARDFKGSVSSSNSARNWALLGMLFWPVCYILFVICTSLLAIFV